MARKVKDLDSMEMLVRRDCLACDRKLKSHYLADRVWATLTTGWHPGCGKTPKHRIWFGPWRPR